MPLDSNSRFIAGVCGVAVLLLVAWLHGNAQGIDHRIPSCDPSGVPQDQARECASCPHEETSRIIGDAPSLPIRFVTPAPRS
ncbi:hypothetical protein LJR143_000620 [Pseudoxanthomonas sp. LjRoot143]|uniref:hypothetical protein n=1 Tax=unclassified Pseudoxanthomonas TaxID=2645906 RepID=UPI00177E5E93|nr:hypothetical protein [Pseudoxanthomonas sp. PXM01]MBD9468542.1 hypothetical protein [Pseudoxanthomonas sp. PXM01]